MTTSPLMFRELIVAAAIVDSVSQPTRLLCAARAYPASLRGKFELPGGKVEAGEKPKRALEREIREELGTGLTISHKLKGPLEGDWPLLADRVMRVWVAQIDGEPQLSEAHERLEWCGKDQVLGLPWIEADFPIIKALVSDLRWS